MTSMIKDFTKIGKVSPVSTGDTTEVHILPNANNQRIVLLAIWLSAVAFFVAGIWLILGMPSPFARDISLYLGIGFIVSSMADVIAIKFIKRAWAMKQGQ